MQLVSEAALRAGKVDRGCTFDEFLKTASDVGWTIRASGGLMRSYKRNKSTYVHLGTCAPNSGWGEVRWDGLFFSLWSSRLSEATDWICAPGTYQGVRRCLWTEKIDPIHTIYIADPLSDQEIKEAASKGETLTHILALSLLPWSTPLHWLLVLEGYLRDRWSLGKYLRGLEPLETSVVDRMEALFPALCDVPKREAVQDLTAGTHLLTSLPTACSHDDMQALADTYRNPAYNRSSCMSVVDARIEETTAEITISLKSESREVEDAYGYLKPDAPVNAGAFASVRDCGSYACLAEQAHREAIDHLPERFAAVSMAELQLAAARQLDYYERVARLAPGTAEAAYEMAHNIATLVGECEPWINQRVDHIQDAIKTAAAFTVKEPITVTIESYEQQQTTVIGLPVMEGLLQAVREEGGQVGLPVHISHMIQPCELLRLQIAGQLQELLHGPEGGLVIAEV